MRRVSFCSKLTILEQEWLRKLDTISPVRKIATYKKIGFVAALALIVGLIAVGIVLIRQYTVPAQATIDQQREAVTIYCLSQNADMTREECAEFADVLLNNSNLAATIAQCTNLYSENLDSFTACMQDVMVTLDRIRANDITQVTFLLEYCSNHLLDYFQDQPCLDWANEVNIRFPTALSVDECWHLDVLGSILFEEHTLQVNAAVECIRNWLDMDFPPLPSCDATNSSRITCTQPDSSLIQIEISPPVSIGTNGEPNSK